MADDRRRRHLGDAASAALPMLWQILSERGWTHARLAAELEEDGGKVARLLYGDRRPGRTLAWKLWLVVSIPIELWDADVPAGWLPRDGADESGEHEAAPDAPQAVG